MLKKPKHFPVYVASYLDSTGKIGVNSIVAKVIKKKNNSSIEDRWGNPTITSINLPSLYSYDFYQIPVYSEPPNTFGHEDAILVPKDTWIKYVNLANKFINEENKKKGSSIKRIPY